MVPEPARVPEEDPYEIYPLMRRLALAPAPPRRILSGQTVAVQYTGVVWRTGRVFDASWARGFPLAFVLGGDQMVPGWDQGLGGLAVGSRVLIVVPPDLAYGRAAQPPSINSGDTLVFVVDILAAVEPTP